MVYLNTWCCFIHAVFRVINIIFVEVEKCIAEDKVITDLNMQSLPDLYDKFVELVVYLVCMTYFSLQSWLNTWYVCHISIVKKEVLNALWAIASSNKLLERLQFIFLTFRSITVTFLESMYSLRSILLFINMDVSSSKMWLDTSVLAKSNMCRREYLNTKQYHLLFWVLKWHSSLSSLSIECVNYYFHFPY
jgi:hypothetical protein